MFVTIINDCSCANAQARQTTRCAALFDCAINFLAVKSDLQAAGNLIDVLDASQGQKGLVLTNVAPRHGQAKRWSNGTPFAYFWHQDTLVIGSVDGLTFSLVKKLGLTDNLQVLDIPKSVSKLAQQKIISQKLAEQIANTQFRSYEFLPRAGKWILDGVQLSSEQVKIEDVPDSGHKIWWVDNFGNCKTTVLANELDERLKNKLKKKFKQIEFEIQLKSVTDNQLAVIIGSSGIGQKRFLEIVIQGQSAAKKFKFGPDQDIA